MKKQAFYNFLEVTTGVEHFLLSDIYALFINKNAPPHHISFQSLGQINFTLITKNKYAQRIYMTS